jgi:hypothetical protein
MPGCTSHRQLPNMCTCSNRWQLTLQLRHTGSLHILNMQPPRGGCCCPESCPRHSPFISSCVTSPTTAGASRHLATNSLTSSLAGSALRRT